MSKIKFINATQLLPVVIQDDRTNEVLMLGYMNQLAWQKTQATGWVYFWSRSRNALWLKGETSGNKLKLKSSWLDCDADTLLLKVEVIGQAVCHTGQKSCFFTEVKLGKL